MAQTRIGTFICRGLWALLLLITALSAAGCPAPPPPPEVEKPREQPLIYRMLVSSDQKQLLDYLKPILSAYDIEYDTTLRYRENPDNVFPKYEPAINTIFLPPDKQTEDFLRRIADSAGISTDKAESLLPGDLKKDVLLRFARNVFLCNELAEYIRNQHKIFNYINPFEEEEAAQEFTRTLISHFSGTEPEVKPLPQKLATFYEKLLSHAPGDFPGLSKNITSVKDWYNKNYAKLSETKRSSLLLYRMARQFAHFKKEQADSLAEFIQKNISEPGTRIKNQIKLSDKMLCAQTVYRGKTLLPRRVGYSYQFRGLSGVAAGHKGRIFFSDYRNINQVTRDGSRDTVEGSRGIFAPTGFCTDPEGKFYFVDRDMVRIVNLPGRSVSNIMLAGKLKGSFACDPHGITPIAVNEQGRVLIVNNSTRTLSLLSGEGTPIDSTTLRGVAGGVAFAGDHVYVTNTTHHTVDRVDFGTGAAAVAGVQDYPGHGDGKGFEVFFNSPTGICVNKEGAAFVADTFNHAIRKIDTDGSVSTVIGIERGSADGSAETAGLHCPVGVAVDKNGTLYVVELSSERIVMISKSKKQIESKPVPVTGVSGIDSTDKETAELSGIIKSSTVGYRLYDTYMRRGIRYRELKDFGKSSADLEAAGKIAPEKLSAYVEAGITQEAAGQMDEAINIYTLAISKKKDLVPVERFRDQDFLHALMQRGLAQASEDNFTAALEDLTAVIDLRKLAVETFKEPDLPRDKVAGIWFTRGKIHLKSGNPDKAVSDFNRAIIIDNKFTKAYYQRGLAYKSTGKHMEAVKDLLKAASIEAGYAAPHYVLGQIYQDNIVDNSKAIQHLKTYIALKGANKADAEARIEELKKKLDRTSVPDEAFWEETVEDNEGRRWILRHYASGKTQKFPVKEK